MDIPFITLYSSSTCYFLHGYSFESNRDVIAVCIRASSKEVAHIYPPNEVLAADYGYTLSVFLLCNNERTHIRHFNER